jgi:nucleoside-diphosphate-sugar epimerase
MLSGQPPVIFGDGQQSRDYTYVANVIQACVLAASAGQDAVGEALNTGCEGRTSLVALVATLNELLGTHIEPVFSAPRRGDVRHSQASVAKAGRLLGYRPLVNLRDGLSRTIDWFAEGGRKAPEPAGALLGASEFSTRVNEEGINGVA